MPGRGHETGIKGLVKPTENIFDQLEVCATASVKDFVKKVQDCGSSDIFLNAGGKHPDLYQPDAQFCFDHRRYPSCVYEVALKQSSKEVATKAETYIRVSKGHIRTVVILDIEDDQWKNVTLTVWRAVLNKKGTLVDIVHGRTVRYYCLRSQQLLLTKASFRISGAKVYRISTQKPGCTYRLRISHSTEKRLCIPDSPWFPYLLVWRSSLRW